MDGQQLFTLVMVLLILIWMGELVWLFRSSEQHGQDPIRAVSGAAPFFVAAAPVAISAPNLVDRVGGFFERVIPSRGGGHASSPMRMPARLLINGEERTLDLPRVRMGRYPNNEIVLEHSTVSAYHAEIIQRPDGRHEIVDRESRNGTRVNGALVRGQVLRDGDLITLGGASIHYLSESSTDPRAVGMSDSFQRGPHGEPVYDDAEPMDYNQR